MFSCSSVWCVQLSVPPQDCPRNNTVLPPLGIGETWNLFHNYFRSTKIYTISQTINRKFWTKNLNIIQNGYIVITHNFNGFLWQPRGLVPALAWGCWNLQSTFSKFATSTIVGYILWMNRNAWYMLWARYDSMTRPCNISFDKLQVQSWFTRRSFNIAKRRLHLQNGKIIYFYIDYTNWIDGLK